MKGSLMIRSVAAAALLIAVPVSAQDAVPTEAEGKIVIYRGGSVWGAGVACPVRYEGKEVVELGRGKFAEWSVAPGRYILTNKTASVEVNVAAGETRYVRCQIKTGFMSGRADLQIVDRASFEDVQGDLERKDIAAR